MLPARRDRGYVRGVSTLLALALLVAPPTEGGSESSSAPAPASETQPAAQPEDPAPPPPKLTGPGPEVEAPPVEDSPEGSVPGGTTPPGEGAAPPVPTGPEPPPSEAELEYTHRSLADMPYGATAARKSAIRRNNDILVRPFRQPVYSVAASGRFGTLLGGGADVVQPFGYGFAMQLRLHVLRVGKSRFGAELHAGHTRFQQRRDFETVEGGATVTRITLLTDTDFSAGPSFQVPLGPLFLQLGGSAGVALSTLFRPRSADGGDDQRVSTTNFMLRGGLSVGVPLLNRHGLTFGAGVHHIFSPYEVTVDPNATVDPDNPDPDVPMTRPFGTWLEVLLGYQIWF
jgi:hypothetical protein